MIGDWFRYSYTIDGREKVKTFRISRIENELGKYYVWGNGYGRMCYPDRLEPIPITPEILEKNGFNKLGFEGWEFDSEEERIQDCPIYTILWRRDYPSPHNTSLKITSFVAGIGNFNRFDIKYVHDLQHALRLCGIDKTIEL